MSDNTLILIGVAGAMYYYFVMNKKESQADTLAKSDALNNGATESSNDQSDTNHDYKGNAIPNHQTFHTMPVEATPQPQPKSATM